MRSIAPPDFRSASQPNVNPFDELFKKRRMSLLRRAEH